MDYKRYFDDHKGLGILSTANGDGIVNSAVYARPYVQDDGQLAFVMRDRLSHHNLLSNPHAAYLFREEGAGYKGVRFHLTKTGEESGTELVGELCRRCKISGDPEAMRFVVTFRIDEAFALIGAGAPEE
jgi:hypothetical protein